MEVFEARNNSVGLIGLLNNLNLMKAKRMLILVILSANRLEKRSFDITKYLSHIIKVFKDFKLVQEIRKEIESVRPCLVMAS